MIDLLMNGLRLAMKEKLNILIHCRGGNGRSSTVETIIRVLLLRMSLEQALEQKAREPGKDLMRLKRDETKKSFVVECAAARLAILEGCKGFAELGGWENQDSFVSYYHENPLQNARIEILAAQLKALSKKKAS